MQNLILPILWVVVAINTILGIVILSRGFNNIKNIFFSCISFSSALWGFSIIAFSQSIKIEFFNINVNWLDFTHFFALCVAFLFFIFASIFPKMIFRNRLVYIIGSLIFIIIIYFILYTDYIVGERLMETLNYTINPGYKIYGLSLVLYFALGYFFLFVQYKKADDYISQLQIKYILIGSILASGLAIIPDLLLPYLGIFNYTWLGPLFTLIMVFSIFFAMIRYKLFDIKIIFTEVFSGLIIFVLFIDIFLAKNNIDLIIKTLILIIISFFGFFLIKSVYKEITQREKIENLANNLAKTNNQLTEAYDRLKELDQLKSEFMSMASHQIRSPLTAIKGYASEIIEGDFGDLPRYLKVPVETIFKSANSLLQIVEDFLNISRIEQGRMEYDFSDVDLRSLIKEVVDENQPKVVEKGIALSFRDLKENLKVRADRGKLRQVINNLVDNAVKYTPNGAVTISLIKKENQILIKISDTGVGMSQKTINNLFQKFSRAEEARKANIQGTGLGLYVARELVLAHQGDVWAESEGAGKGSVFWVRLNLIS